MIFRSDFPMTKALVKLPTVNWNVFSIIGGDSPNKTGV